MSRKFLRHGSLAVGLFLLVALLIFPACGTVTPPVNEPLLMRIAESNILVEPWNPVAGSNWVFDRMPQSAMQDMSVVPDPNTGLYVPWRIEKAEVTVVTSLASLVGVTPPNDEWLTLGSAGTINVPSAAWADWDAANMQWIPAGTGKTAKTKVVVYYPKSIWNIKYHDGSSLSPVDFMLPAILAFDRAKPTSAIYDEAYVPSFDAFMEHFKGVTFDFDNPDWGLVVTTYDDAWYLDAEWIVGLVGANTFCWYPISPYGQFNFESTALGILAESNKQLAFSSEKADAESVDWQSLIAGPSLNILLGNLNKVLDSTDAKYRYIPYSPILGTYITQADALTRYNNLKTFYNTYHHFYIGTGPYYLANVNTSGKILDLKKFTSYNAPGDQFFSYMKPVPTGYDDVTGGWVDEIVMSMEGVASAAITKLANNEIDVYAYGVDDPALKTTVDNNADLYYYNNAGSFNEMTLNPAGNATNPFFSDGRLNPFALPVIREACNKAVDRNYIGRDVMGGLGSARFTTIGPLFADGIRYKSNLDAIASTYAYNFNTADAAIAAAMLAIPGVTRGTDKKYSYNGTPVEMKVLIRIEDARKQIGNYFANQMEALGFKVTRQEGASAVLAPIWRRSDPDLGQWNAYTGGWVNTGVPRDDGTNFGFYYTDLGAPVMGTLWSHYTPTAEFYGVAKKLYINDFNSVAERGTLFSQAFDMSMKDSCRIFLVDRLAFSPLRKNVATASDLAAGIYASYLWGQTIHFRDANGVPITPAT